MKPKSAIQFVLYVTISVLIAGVAIAADAEQQSLTPTSLSNTFGLGPEPLNSAFESLQDELKKTPIADSFTLKAQVFEKLTKGDVYALMPFDYDVLSETLTTPGHICEAIVLHINVKGCITENASSKKPLVDMYVGRKEYQHPQDAVKVQYEFSVSEHRDNYTLISLTADKGPLRTQNIAIYIEFLPVDNQTSFIHFAYSANYGGLARFALNTYLATLGRNKVGFTATGVDKHGEPIYIKGIQGVVERNTMRYFFALHSYFSTYQQPETQRFDASLNQWFDYVEKYPRQLLELPRDEYLEAKHKEHRDESELAAVSKQS